MRIFNIFLLCLLLACGTASAANARKHYTNEWYCFRTDRLHLGAERPVGITPEMAGHGMSFAYTPSCFTAPEGACSFIAAYASYVADEEGYYNEQWYEDLDNIFLKKGWHLDSHYSTKTDGLLWYVSTFSRKTQGRRVEAMNFQARTLITAPFGEADSPIEYNIRAVFPKSKARTMRPLVKQMFNSFRHTEPCHSRNRK